MKNKKKLKDSLLANIFSFCLFFIFVFSVEFYGVYPSTITWIVAFFFTFLTLLFISLGMKYLIEKGGENERREKNQDQDSP